MEFSENGQALLKKLEGYSDHPYKDSGGLWTIGYGTRIGIDLHGEFTLPHVDETRATELLLQHCQPMVAFINHVVAVPLSQNQFDTLVLFVYNIGDKAFETSTLLALLNKGQYNQIPSQLMRWVSVKGIMNPGLKARRTAEGELWNSK